MWFVKGRDAATFLNCITLNYSTALCSATFPISLSSRNKWKYKFWGRWWMYRTARDKPHSLLFGQFILSTFLSISLKKQSSVSLWSVLDPGVFCSLSQGCECPWQGQRAGLGAGCASLMDFESFPVRSAGNVLLLMSTPTQLPGTLYSQENLGFLPTTATVCFR